MKNDNLKKCDQLQKELTEMIESGAYRAHDRFFSVEKLKAMYGVSQVTVVETLKRLEMEGFLYRRPSSGTYISPPQKVRQILLVARQSRIDSEELNSFIYHLESNMPEMMNCRITFVRAEEFERCFEDLELHYRNTSAVIFFRTTKAFSSFGERLTTRGILNIFYGSSCYREELGGRNCFYYDERQLVKTVLDRLYEAGHRKISCIYDSFEVFNYRKDMYVEWMNEHGLTPDIRLDGAPARTYTVFSKLPRQELGMTAIFSVYYGFALEAVQALLHRNIKVPGDISIIGIGRPAVCRFFHPQPSMFCIDHNADAATLIRQIDAALRGKSFEIPGGNSNFFLIEGKTIQKISSK